MNLKENKEEQIGEFRGRHGVIIIYSQKKERTIFIYLFILDKNLFMYLRSRNSQSLYFNLYFKYYYWCAVACVVECCF